MDSQSLTAVRTQGLQVWLLDYLTGFGKPNKRYIKMNCSQNKHKKIINIFETTSLSGGSF